MSDGMSDGANDAVFRIGFTVLDRQIVDADGANVGKVDDVEFTWDEGEPPAMTALVGDTAALGPRIAGRAGLLWEAVLGRLRPPDEEPTRIPVGDVVEFAPATVLSTPAPRGMRPLETWVARHVIGRIPGGRR
jgi:sporulation protein YlmC with PRC-barrel domain